MTDRTILTATIQRAADRADYVSTPATEAQVRYLAGLLTELGKDQRWIFGANTNAILAKKQASNYIADLKLEIERRSNPQAIETTADQPVDPWAAACAKAQALFPEEWAAAQSLSNRARKHAERDLRARAAKEN